jgi:hypothetical protein
MPRCRVATSSPPQLRRGGRDIKKKTAQPPLMERTGWCWSKRMHDFLTNTTPSARLWSLRGILTSRSHPSSAEEGSRAHPNVFGQLWSQGDSESEFQTAFRQRLRREPPLARPSGSRCPPDAGGRGTIER